MAIPGHGVGVVGDGCACWIRLSLVRQIEELFLSIEKS